jgi:predicted GIY-YIG superfamily endonuclease
MQKKWAGVYVIYDNFGDFYIGSSFDVIARCKSHRAALRRGAHKNKRLLKSFAKSTLVFFLPVHVCNRDDCVVQEQRFIDDWKPRLNIMKRAIVSRPAHRPYGVSVVDNKGNVFRSYTQAAEMYGTTPAHIKLLCESQSRGRLGVRFRRFEDDWRAEMTPQQIAVMSRRESGNAWHSENTKRKMRKNRVDWRPSQAAIDAAADVAQKAVVGIPISGNGVEIFFQSIKSAGEYFGKSGRNAGHSITRVLLGYRLSAYGYKWQYAEAKQGK